jgi:hypothetical protein
MKTTDNQPNETDISEILSSLSVRSSRRSVMKKAAVGTGVAAVAAGALLLPRGLAHASTTSANAESTVQILSVAATAEQLAVTFYSEGIKHAHRLGITGSDLDYLKAAVIEEQIHQNFLVANGGKALASTFSFPHGYETFERLSKFIATLEQLEDAFIAAYLAAVNEFAQMGSPTLAVIAAEICSIESEHRALGRDIGNLVPADNHAFAPASLKTVGAAVAALEAAGYLSPRVGNRFTYHAVSTTGGGVVDKSPVLPG